MVDGRLRVSVGAGLPVGVRIFRSRSFGVGEWVMVQLLVVVPQRNRRCEVLGLPLLRLLSTQGNCHGPRDFGGEVYVELRLISMATASVDSGATVILLRFPSCHLARIQAHR
jgi:hypothetical protein